MGRDRYLEARVGCSPSFHNLGGNARGRRRQGNITPCTHSCQQRAVQKGLPRSPRSIHKENTALQK